MIAIVVVPDQASAITNTAVVSSKAADPDTSNNSAVVSMPVVIDRFELLSVVMSHPSVLTAF
jgi:hypothetical protein